MLVTNSGFEKSVIHTKHAIYSSIEFRIMQLINSCIREIRGKKSILDLFSAIMDTDESVRLFFNELFILSV